METYLWTLRWKPTSGLCDGGGGRGLSLGAPAGLLSDQATFLSGSYKTIRGQGHQEVKVAKVYKLISLDV